jgi:OFA family oxalate/formate antiporter-like MFS transporter
MARNDRHTDRITVAGMAARPSGHSAPLMVFGLRPENGRWIILALGVAMQICLGAVYSWSVFALPLKSHFARSGVNLSYTQLNLPFLVFLGCFALVMPIAGRLYVKRKPLAIFLLGSTLVGAGWLLSGLVIGNVSTIGLSAFPLFVMAYGGLAGCGVGVAYGGPIAASAKWFPERKGLAMGVSVMGFGVSTTITAPIADYIIERRSVADAFLVLGAVFFIALCLLSLLIRFPPTGWRLSGWAAPQITDEAAGQNAKPFPVYRSARFWALWSCLLIGSAIGLMAIGISKTVAVDENYIALDNATAIFAVSFFALPSGLGRILFGWLADRVTPRCAALLSFSLAAAGAVGMLVAGKGDAALFILCFSLFWMTLGGWLSLVPAAAGAFWGPRRQPEVYGSMFTAYGVGGILGNLLSGVADDVFGSYRVVFFPVLFLACIGIIVAFIGLKPPSVPESEGV